MNTYLNKHRGTSQSIAPLLVAAAMLGLLGLLAWLCPCAEEKKPEPAKPPTAEAMPPGGFTLVELLVVLVIMAVLAALAAGPVKMLFLHLIR